jgi:hypothetical protein
MFAAHAVEVRAGHKERASREAAAVQMGFGAEACEPELSRPEYIVEMCRVLFPTCRDRIRDGQGVNVSEVQRAIREFFGTAALDEAEAADILGRLSTTEAPTPPTPDLDGLEGKALARAEAEQRYRRDLAAWRSSVRGAMWLWEAAVLRASTSASDVATLMRATLPTVASCLVWRSLQDD